MNKKKQYLIPGNDLDHEVMHLETWDIKTAVRLIAAGLEFPPSIIALYRRFGEQEIQDWVAAVDAVNESIGITARIAKSSIEAGRLKNPDSKEKWLAWAKLKGYSINHLTGEGSSPTFPLPVPAARKKNPSLDFNELNDEQLLSKKDLCVWLNRSESSINRDIKKIPNFPQPISTGNRSVRFKVKDIRKYLKSLQQKA